MDTAVQPDSSHSASSAATQATRADCRCRNGHLRPFGHRGGVHHRDLPWSPGVAGRSGGAPRGSPACRDDHWSQPPLGHLLIGRPELMRVLTPGRAAAAAAFDAAARRARLDQILAGAAQEETALVPVHAFKWSCVLNQCGFPRTRPNPTAARSSSSGSGSSNREQSFHLWSRTDGCRNTRSFSARAWPT